MKTKNRNNKVLTIDRRKWMRGIDGVMRDKSGKMCCLGFESLRCGLKPQEILNRQLPDTFNFPALYACGKVNSISESRLKKINKLLKHLLKPNGENKKITNDLCEVNDNFDIDDTEREKKITRLFTKLNIKVEFIN